MNIEKDLMKQAKQATKATDWNPLKPLRSVGVKSSHAYTAGFISVGVAFATWLASRGKDDSKAQSDRWGLFIGQWAPTFFAIGIALKQEEKIL